MPQDLLWTSRCSSWSSGSVDHHEHIGDAWDNSQQCISAGLEPADAHNNVVTERCRRIPHGHPGPCFEHREALCVPQPRLRSHRTSISSTERTIPGCVSAGVLGPEHAGKKTVTRDGVEDLTDTSAPVVNIMSHC